MKHLIKELAFVNKPPLGAHWALMLNAIAYAYPIKCLSFEGQFNEVSRND